MSHSERVVKENDPILEDIRQFKKRLEATFWVIFADAHQCWFN
jgi:hypothetical protein